MATRRKNANQKGPIARILKERTKRVLQDEVAGVVSCYKAFMSLAQKFGMDDTKKASKYWGVTRKQAKSLLGCDLTIMTRGDYIKCTADLCFLGYTLECKARGNE